MQFLAAPTRYEVNRAHLKCKPSDIGVQSVRNLLYISKKRSSAVPDASPSTQSYVRQTGRDVDQAAHTTPIGYNSAKSRRRTMTCFLERRGLFTEILFAPNPSQVDPSTIPPSLVVGRVIVLEDPSIYDPKNDLPIRAKTMRNLTKEQCIVAYAHNLVSAYRDVVLIVRGNMDFLGYEQSRLRDSCVAKSASPDGIPYRR
jgi:hypothetical protein